MALDLSTFVAENIPHWIDGSNAVPVVPLGNRWHGPYVIRVERIVADKAGRRYHVINYITLEDGVLMNVECTVEPLQDE